MNNQNYDYGKCHVCGADMVEKEVNQDYWVRGELVVIENIPSGVCIRCGERVLKADVGKQVIALLSDLDGLQSARKIHVPVLEFRHAA